jgi:glycosyltransferase involved in cell wall biosynthesis
MSESSARSRNVLFVTGWYPVPERSSFAPFVHEHARAVQSAGHTVKVLQVWPMQSKDWFRKSIHHRTIDGIESWSMILQGRWVGALYWTWPVLGQLIHKMYERYLAPDFKPDLLHGHVVYPAGTWTRSLAQQLEVPYVLTEHWSKVQQMSRYPFYRPAIRKVYEDAATVCPVSHHLEQIIEDAVGDRTDMEVVPNVVDAEEFYPLEPTKQQQRKQEGEIHLLSVLNMAHPSKHPEWVLEALQALPGDLQNRIRWTIIGAGQEHHPLQKKIAEYRLSGQIELMGMQPKEEVAEKMRQADVLLHPSEGETFGVVVAEALQCGLPCLVSDVPALDEWVDEHNGRLIAGNKAEAWADVLAQLPKLLPTWNKRKIASKASRLFALEEVGAQFDTIYDRILDK